MPEPTPAQVNWATYETSNRFLTNQQKAIVREEVEKLVKLGHKSVPRGHWERLSERMEKELPGVEPMTAQQIARLVYRIRQEAEGSSGGVGLDDGGGSGGGQADEEQEEQGEEQEEDRRQGRGLRRRRRRRRRIEPESPAADNMEEEPEEAWLGAAAAASGYGGGSDEEQEEQEEDRRQGRGLRRHRG